MIVLLFGLAGVGSSEAAPPTDFLASKTFEVMGTKVTVTVLTDDEKKAANANRIVESEFQRVDKLMSSWKSGSDVAALNKAPVGKWVKVNPEVFSLVVKAHKAWRSSSGAFDITVGGFRGLWKFDQDRDGTIPAAEQVKKRLTVIGFDKLKIDRKRKRLKKTIKGMRITLGGIAKGYALKRSVALLHKAGLVDFIVQAGGDLYASGKKRDRQWRVGIRDPRRPPGQPFAFTEVKDRTFSTSGDYERSVIKDGKRYHHILDPKTGFPADACRSVTVMAKDPVVADIWSTSLFVLGPKRGLAIVEKMPNVDAVFVDGKNKLFVSSGLQGQLKLLRQPTPGI